MAEVLGPQSVADLAYSTGIDPGEALNWSMKEGISFGEFMNRVAAAIGARNQEFVTKYGDVMSITEEIMMEYPDGNTVVPSERRTDFDTPDSTAGTTIGHMLPLYYHAEAASGSKKYWQRTRTAKLNATIKAFVDKLVWRFELDIFQRLFSNEEFLIGSSGYNVPFVRGTGGNIDFTPPAYSGKPFDSSHNHYLGFNLSTPLTHGDMLDGLAATLFEHGHEPPYTAYVSSDDILAYHALTNFVKLVSINTLVLDRGGASSGNQFFAQGQPMLANNGLFGKYQSPYGEVDLRAFYRVPDNYASMFKSYGNMDARNPLAVRVAEDGFGMMLVPELNGSSDWPIKKLAVTMEHGVGVGEDRTNGAVGFLVAGGTYINGTVR